MADYDRAESIPGLGVKAKAESESAAMLDCCEGARIATAAGIFSLALKKRSTVLVK